jgi:hypothetical protein
MLNFLYSKLFESQGDPFAEVKRSRKIEIDFSVDNPSSEDLDSSWKFEAGVSIKKF